MTARYGNFLQRWSINTSTGEIGCFHDALDVRAMPVSDLDLVEAYNTLVLSLKSELEAYQAALATPEPVEPFETPVYNDEGEQVGTEPTPAYAAWSDAEDVMAGTSDEALALHTWRKGEPEQYDENEEETAEWLEWQEARTVVLDALGDAPDLSVDPNDAVATRQRDDAINTERDRRLRSGVIIEVTGYGSLPVQGRMEDQVNLLALKDTADDLFASEITAAVIPFRDGNNEMHMFTPAQMMELATKGKTAASQIYQASWAIKADPELDYLDDANWAV